MRIELIARALWQHHRRASVITIVGLVALLAAPFLFHASFSCLGSVDTADSDRGHLVLDRVWFDRYPDEPRTEMAVWLWLSSGIGVYQQGSQYRASFDVFEFVRNGRDLDMTFLQDDERARTRFTVDHCDVEPPFDLCLTLDDAARGPARYYSFSDRSGFLNMPPWARQVDIEARAAAHR